MKNPGNELLTAIFLYTLLLVAIIYEMRNITYAKVSIPLLLYQTSLEKRAFE